MLVSIRCLKSGKNTHPLMAFNATLFFLVLIPGFEPGSTDRESVMMDHYTIPAVYVTRVHVYMSSAIYSESENSKINTFSFYYMFTFSLLPISLVHMLTVDGDA